MWLQEYCFSPKFVYEVCLVMRFFLLGKLDSKSIDQYLFIITIIWFLSFKKPEVPVSPLCKEKTSTGSTIIIYPWKGDRTLFLPQELISCLESCVIFMIVTFLSNCDKHHSHNQKLMWSYLSCYFCNIFLSLSIRMGFIFFSTLSIQICLVPKIWPP